MWFTLTTTGSGLKPRRVVPALHQSARRRGQRLAGEHGGFGQSRDEAPQELMETKPS